MIKILIFAFVLVVSSFSRASCIDPNDTNIHACETDEIRFTGEKFGEVSEKAAELGSALNIFEYLRNNATYKNYYGAKSNSLNSLIGLVGNDLDLSTTLIAMLRSQNIKSRYAVGIVRISTDALANWLGIQNPNLMPYLMAYSGLSNVSFVDNDVLFEHVWVEALVNYVNYRGVNDNSSDCTEESNTCRWIPLDPSFKRYDQDFSHSSALGSVEFDYLSYYAAEAPSLPSVNENGERCSSNDPKYDVSFRYAAGASKCPAYTSYLACIGRHSKSYCESHTYLTGPAPDCTKIYTTHEEECEFVENPNYVKGLKNQNPLEIFQNSAMAVLRNSSPGLTLKDVAGQRIIISENLGVLPSSLPYKVVNPAEIKRYASIAAHDQSTDVRAWSRVIQSKIRPVIDGVACDITYDLPAVKLSTLSTSRFSLVWDSPSDTLVSRIGNTSHNIVTEGNILCNGDTLEFGYADFFNLELDLDGTVAGSVVLNDEESATDFSKVNALYPNLSMSGYYVIASGGEESSWSQVQRAYEELLEDYKKYPLVTRVLLSNGNYRNGSDQYVDYNFDGVGDPLTEPKFIDDTEAQDALISGLLYAGQRLYYARLQENHEEYEQLKNITYLVNGRVGVVSSELAFDQNQLDISSDTSFGVSPGGLLIDLKGNYYLGGWDNVTGEPVGIEHDKFTGHMSSSLEHEVWQELTGFDAISTVKGFQLSQKAGIELEELIIDDNVDELSMFLSNIGYTPVSAAGYELANESITLFGREYTTWNYTGGMASDPGLEGFLASKSLPLNDKIVYFSSGVRDLLEAYDSLENELLQHDPITQIEWTSCLGTSTKEVGEHLDDHSGCFDAVLLDNDLTDILDNLVNLDPSSYLFRSFEGNRYSAESLASIWNNIYGNYNPGERWEIVLPNEPLTENEIGTGYIFDVFYSRKSEGHTIERPEGFTIDETYSIANLNRIAGGGYVTDLDPLSPPNELEGFLNDGGEFNYEGVDFFNTTWTDKNLNFVSNNDLILTPSTWDPVSTITGNMYHDETDISIKGIGLDWLVTRTYNSDSKHKQYGPGSVGNGWMMSTKIRLTSNDYGEFPNYSRALKPENANNKTSSITYTNERGGETNYLLDDSNTNAQPTAGYMTFDSLEIDEPQSGQYTLEFRNGVKYIFRARNESLRNPDMIADIYQIIHPNGQAFTYHYDASFYLQSITDNSGIEGRSGLSFSYNDEGLLRYVSDWAGRRWEYIYDGDNLIEVKDPEPLISSMQYTYEPGTSLLVDIIKPADRDGKKVATKFSYYANDRAFDYSDQLGNTESLTYDLYRKNTTIHHPDGTATTHHYDSKGALLKLDEADGGILTFENNDDGFRYIKRDGLGYETKYSYNTSRALGGGSSDTFGKVTREQDALGNNVDYTYGIFDKITEVTDKRGVVTKFEYYQSTDASIDAVKGELKRVIMPVVTVNGSTFTNVTLKEIKYFPSGQPREIINYIDPADPSRKQVSTFTYEEVETNYAGLFDAYKVREVVRGESTDDVVIYDKWYDRLWRLGREAILDEQFVTLSSSSYAYDVLGRLLVKTLPNGDKLENIYDENGKIRHKFYWHILPASGALTTKHQNCALRQAGYKQFHMCRISTLDYDEVDRLVSETNIEGSSTRYFYDSVGRLLTTVDANNQHLKFEYDAKGRKTAITDQNGHRIETVYDLAGRATQTVNPNGGITRFSYDALGRITKTVSPEGRETQFTAYDGNGNLLAMKDANAVAGLQPVNIESSSLFKEYDELGRVVRSLNASNEETLYRYDLLGNLTGITDAEGQQTTFIYDDLGRLTKVYDPIFDNREQAYDQAVIECGSLSDDVCINSNIEENRSNYDLFESYTYDELGNMLSKTDRKGQRTTYDYDQLNRLISVVFRDNGAVIDAINYTYDQYGDLVGLRTRDIQYTYTYDNLHRLLSKTDDRNNQTLSWTYDDVGNILTKTDYQGDVTTYTYDGSNRLISMSNPAYLSASYQYDGNGRLLSRTLSNGASTQYQYDRDGFLLELTQRAADGSIIDYRRFTPDEIGNIEEIVINDTETIDYSYDPSYRLISADSTNNSHDFSYSYDGVGNRLTKTAQGSTYHYAYNNAGNRLDEVRLNSATGPIFKRYEYDANGNRVKTFDGVDQLLQELHYDHRGFVTDITTPTENLSYLYDAKGYRVQKTSASKTNNYLLEGEHLEAIYDENFKLQNSYFRGPIVDEIINGLERDGDTFLNRNFHNDQVNSLVASSDHNGEVLRSVQYSPFGEMIESTGQSANDFKYTGREQDSETGLYYYRARYYDPEIGMFTSEDPLGFNAGVNFYSYVNGNPNRFNDPMGEDAVDLNFGVLGGTLGFDDASGQMFWKLRVGLAGLGLAYDPQSNAPNLGPNFPAECSYCSVSSLSWSNVNISAGVTLGLLDWSPIKYDTDMIVNENFYDIKISDTRLQGNGLEFDPTNISSVLEEDGSKIGLNLSLNANYEFGGTIEWSSIRSYFGLGSAKIESDKTALNNNSSYQNSYILNRLYSKP